MERLASFTVDTGGVVPTVARLPSTTGRTDRLRRRPDGVVPVRKAPRRVPVTLAPTADRHVGQGVVNGPRRRSASSAASPPTSGDIVRRQRDPRRSENDANVRHGDPVL